MGKKMLIRPSKTKKAEVGQPAKEQSQLDRKMTIDDARRYIAENMGTSYDPKSLMIKVAEKLPAYLDRKLDSAEAEGVGKLIREVIIMNSLDTRAVLPSVASEAYRIMAMEVGEKLKDEFKCETASEKALVLLATKSFIQSMEMAVRLNNSIGFIDSNGLVSERISYLAVISKHIDRCDRQFISAISALRQIKSPPIEFNIKTKTAYVAQNQQINGPGNVIDENVKP